MTTTGKFDIIDEIRGQLYEVSAPSEPCQVVAQFRLMGYWGNQFPGWSGVPDATDAIAAIMVAQRDFLLKEAYEALAKWPIRILQPITLPTGL